MAGFLAAGCELCVMAVFPGVEKATEPGDGGASGASAHHSPYGNELAAPVGDGHAFHPHLFSPARTVNKAVASGVDAGMQSTRA